MPGSPGITKRQMLSVAPDILITKDYPGVTIKAIAAHLPAVWRYEGLTQRP